MADSLVNLDDVINGWDESEIDELDAFLESDIESYSSLLEEVRTEKLQAKISLADTQASIALHTWSVMSSAEKRMQITTELKQDKQHQIFHRLPSTLNLTL